jgi:glutamyl-tRNA reductase
MMLVVGLSHRTAPVQVRERLAAGGDALPAVLARLASRPELVEALFLSTCNRVEVWAMTGDSPSALDDARRAIHEELARRADAGSGDALDPYLYEKRAEEAVAHVFRVAASLDSMVLGEPQILGQVKDAFDVAVAAGTLRATLLRCVTRAFAVAKRVRSETAIGAGTVSISSVAVDLARRVFDDLAERTVLLLGAGEMAEAAARSLTRGCTRSLRICNRSFERAAALAQEMQAAAVPWSDLDAELAVADVVVTSTASPTYVVTRPIVKRAMKARRGRTLLFVDIAVPRNVEPEVHKIGNVYVFNIDDLEQEVARGLEARRGEVDEAERIVREELATFLAWHRGLEVQPTIVALREKARGVFLAELERTLRGRLKHLAEADRTALAHMVESTVGKLLHGPTTRLKARAAESDDASELAAAMRHLFDLEELPSAREHDPPAVVPTTDETSESLN